MAEGGSFVAGAITAKMLLDLSGWSKGIKEVTKDTENVGGSVARMGDAMVSSGKKMAAVGGAIVGTLTVMVKKTADAGDQIYDLSKRTGLSTESLSAYKYAADLSGTSLEGVVTGLRRLSSGMLDSSRGLETAKVTFDALGISVTNADGSLRPMNDVLLDVADRFSKMKDGTEKAAIAQDLFGRSGMDLIPLLNEGREGLARQLAEAEKLGVVFTDKTAAGSDAFNDSLTTLKASLAGATQQFAVQIMPILTEFATGVADVVSKVTDWIKENPQLAKTIGTVGLALGGFLTTAGLLLMTLGRLVITFTQLATAIGATTAAMAASLGAWAAIAAAAVVAYKITNDLIDAKNKLVDADYALFEAQQNLGKKLREAADAAGMTRREFVALTEKYEGNTAAMAMAIKRGKEGKELQEALAKVGAKHGEAIDKQKAALDAAKPSVDAFNFSLKTTTEYYETLEDRFNRLDDDLRMLRMLGKIEIPTIEMPEKFGTLGDVIGGGLAPIVNFVETADGMFEGIVEGNKKAAAESAEAAKAALEPIANLSAEVFGDIINGFGDIISGAASMGQMFSEIVTQMIASMGKLVIMEMLTAKKSILADQMKSIASLISSIFKKIPFPLNVILAAGAFGLVSKLFSKLTKFGEGGSFQKPTVLQNAIVGEAGPEYILPEAKLVRIVQSAMRFNPFTAVPSLTPAAAAAGGAGVTVNINSPLIHTVGLSRRDLESAGEDLMAIVEGQLRRNGKGF